MPFVKCLSGFAEVPYQVPPWSLPVAPRMPKNKPKEEYLVPAPKARLYPKVLIAKCLLGGAEGPYQGQPLCLRKCFKNVLGTRLEGTFECKARLENADLSSRTRPSPDAISFGPTIPRKTPDMITSHGRLEPLKQACFGWHHVMR